MFNIPPPLASSLVEKVSTSLECVICSETMHIPFITECGHSFCYECLFAWFDTKMNCPTCRHELEKLPVINLKLKEISKAFFDMALDVSADEDEKSAMTEQRNNAIKGYEYDRDNKRLFGDLFKSVTTLLDTSDGVPRCGNCHWEANGSECLHCGAHFRNPVHDSDEEVFYNTNGEQFSDDDMNEYDSEDSFVDSRPAEDIEADRESDLLSDESDWHGFNDNAIVVSADEEEYCDDDLISALEEFHDDHLMEVRRPRRVVISDEE